MRGYFVDAEVIDRFLATVEIQTGRTFKSNEKIRLPVAGLR